MADPTDPFARPPRHGGDVDHATRRWGAPKGGWIDLSTGVNPWPYPVSGDPSADLARFPTAAAMTRLLDAARACYAVPDGCGVVSAAGSELLIRQIPHLLPPGAVAIAGPTYRSHREAWAAAGHRVADWKPEAMPPEADALVVANPNNPDGVTLAPERIAALADRSGLLVVDEAFSDLDPNQSALPRLAGTRSVVLRSFGKFFGLPGLRLGFAAGTPDITAELARRLGDWPVSSLAARVGAEALADTGWQAATRIRLSQAAVRLRGLLAASGLLPAGGTNLFQLVAPDDAARVHEALARCGVLTRLFAGAGAIRFGLPGPEAAWERLREALERTAN